MNWRDNPWFNDVLEKERLHAQATMSKIDYENIWGGKSRSAISGAIYVDEIASMYQQGRIGKYPYDPRLLVYPVFDRGFTDRMAIGCWQRRGNTLTCLHYIEDDKKTYSYYAAELKKTRVQLRDGLHTARREPRQPADGSDRCAEDAGPRLDRPGATEAARAA